MQVAPICQRGGLSADTTTSTTTETTTERPECPNGWETYTGDGSSIKCFKYYGGAMYATHAEESCLGQGGHLASVHSFEEQNFLVQTFNPAVEVWIGAVDTDHNGAWEWTDGSPFDFSYWLSDQPDGGQYFTVMDCDDSTSGQWRDLEFDRSYNYICQLTL